MVDEKALPARASSKAAAYSQSEARELVVRF